MKYRGLPAKVNITNVYANPNSDIILPTVPENIKYRELPAAENTTLVLFALNVPSPLKTVLTDVPDTTPATVVRPASLIPIVTFPQNPAPMAVRLTTVVQSARLAKVIQTATLPQNPAPTDVHRPTPAVSVPLVRAIRIAM